MNDCVSFLLEVEVASCGVAFATRWDKVRGFVCSSSIEFDEVVGGGCFPCFAPDAARVVREELLPVVSIEWVVVVRSAHETMPSPQAQRVSFEEGPVVHPVPSHCPQILGLVPEYVADFLSECFLEGCSLDDWITDDW